MLSLLTLIAPAFAVAQFPGDIASDLGMPCTPTCILCHDSASGGGVPHQEFGVAMADQGLTAATSSLAAALDGMAADAVDSDGDGVTDLDQLAAGGNPNPDGADFCLDGGGPPSPVYGCLSQGPAPASGTLALALSFCALLLLRRRRLG